MGLCDRDYWGEQVLSTLLSGEVLSHFLGVEVGCAREATLELSKARPDRKLSRLRGSER